MVIHALWMTAALSCDGDSFSMTAATSPSLEDLVKGIVPGMPRMLLHHPLLAFENGQEFLWAWHEAAQGKLDPFILIVEGSIPNEKLSGEGYWAGFGADPVTKQPIRTTEWIDRLASRAAAVVAVGTCATYGGVPAMKNNPTGAMGLPDYLGWGFRSTEDVPVVCIPGCPAQPDNITETLLYLTLMLAGRAPFIELDEALRPKWLFNRTVHENCNRAAFYEQGSFASEYGQHKCMVKLGCKGPVAKCNVGIRGWVRGRGGCPNVGGICIGCTMPGFPDKFMPFLDSANPVRASANVARFTYGPLLRMMRKHEMKGGSREPAWRRESPALMSGYSPRWEVQTSRPAIPFEAYEVGGRPARRYLLSPTEHVRVEIRDDRVFLAWTSELDAGDWLESMHERIGVGGGALGLIIFGDADIRGDLTWRETRTLLGESAVQPDLVRIDLGQVSKVWTRPRAGADADFEVGVSSPSFDNARFRRLMRASATPKIRAEVDNILEDARLVRRWTSQKS